MTAPRPLPSPTVRAHKRQFVWQILVPFLVVAALLLAAAGLAAAGASAPAWRDVSIIWLIIPMLIFALFLLALLVGLIYGIAKLLQITPRYTAKAQDFFVLISTWARRIADGIAQPVLWVRQAGAMLEAIFKP
ncbi:MAG: hypothetical protein WCE68_02040 [Anaerolineales bacterium]